MAIEYPDSPTINQLYPDDGSTLDNGLIYRWNGEAWVVESGQGDARYVNVDGDTMTSTLHLQQPDGTPQNLIRDDEATHKKYVDEAIQGVETDVLASVDLQKVTDNGNTTTHSIDINDNTNGSVVISPFGIQVASNEPALQFIDYDDSDEMDIRLNDDHGHIDMQGPMDYFSIKLSGVEVLTLHRTGKSTFATELEVNDAVEEGEATTLRQVQAFVNDINLDIASVESDITDLAEDVGENTSQIEANVGNILQLQHDVSVLTEELESIAPSIENGRWEYDDSDDEPADGKYYMLQHYTQADRDADEQVINDTWAQCMADASGDPVAAADCSRIQTEQLNALPQADSYNKTRDFFKCDVLVFANKDLDGNDHAWTAVETGEYIDVFDSGDDDYIIGEITDVLVGASDVQIPITRVQSKGEDDGNPVTIKIFKLADTGVDLGDYLRKSGDSMNGTLHMRGNVPLSINKGSDQYISTKFETGGSSHVFRMDSVKNREFKLVNVASDGSASQVVKLYKNGTVSIGMLNTADIDSTSANAEKSVANVDFCKKNFLRLDGGEMSGGLGIDAGKDEEALTINGRFSIANATEDNLLGVPVFMADGTAAYYLGPQNENLELATVGYVKNATPSLPSTIMYTDTTQSITGTKTFNAGTLVAGNSHTSGKVGINIKGCIKLNGANPAGGQVISSGGGTDPCKWISVVHADTNTIKITKSGSRYYIEG